jgi:hypothetical protein
MGCRILRATAKIDAYVTHYSLQEQPFARTATADSIIAKLQPLSRLISGREP